MRGKKVGLVIGFIFMVSIASIVNFVKVKFIKNSQSTFESAKYYLD